MLPIFQFGGRMLITLFTDASYCSRTQIAAYAAWAKADGYTVRHAGVFKARVTDSSIAEAQALVNGLCFALARLRPGAPSKIIAQTDCLVAIHALTGHFRKARAIKRYAPIVATYAERVSRPGLAVEFRHVSAHKGTITPRNAVNTWCDEACRTLLRQAREADLPSKSNRKGANDGVNDQRHASHGKSPPES